MVRFEVGWDLHIELECAIFQVLQLADVGLQELGRAGLLTLLLAVELVAVPLTPAVVEGLTPLLGVIKVPLGDLVLARSWGTGQETHGSGPSSVLAAVLALGLSDEAVEVSFTAAVVELLALLRLLVVAPPREVTGAEWNIY